ncbi:MAG: hypothetical protein RLZZ399_2419 [Verrucomicrobiota bacterium]|jgi:hypothetical protein
MEAYDTTKPPRPGIWPERGGDTGDVLLSRNL